MSWEHEWLLASLGCPVYFFLDNNLAGRKGQYDAALRLSRSVAVVKVVQYPAHLVADENVQPDNLSADEVKRQVVGSPTFLDWKLSL